MSRIVATYDYTDVAGQLLYQSIRKEPKEFFQRKPDGQGWTYKLNGVLRVLYHLPEVRKAVEAGQTVYIAEGEKDVDNLRALGLVATCNVGGAGKWQDTYSEVLRGADVVILPDNDDPGVRHGIQVAQSLYGVAQRVRKVDLPSLPDHGDVSDWLAQGHTVDELARLVADAPDWSPGTIDTIHSSSQSLEDRAAPRLIHADDLGQLPKAEALIEGVLYRNKLHMQFGRPGVGKSFVNEDIAASVAQYAPVVYVAAEDIEDYPARLEAWREHHNCGTGQLYFWPEPVNLMNPDSVATFLADVQPLEPALIIVDTLQTCMVGADENSTKEMGQAIESLNYIRRQTRAAILVTHHTGWADTHERGNSSLRAACRVVMKLSQSDDGLMTLTCEKINGAKAFEPRYFRLVPQGESVALVPSSKLVSRDDALTLKHFALLEALSLPIFQDGASHSQLVDHTEMAKSTVNKGLSKLLDRGYVEASDGRYKTYTVTATGKHELQTYLFSTAGVSSPRVHSEFTSESELGLNWAIVKPENPEPEFTSSSLDISHQNAVVHSVHSEFTPSSPPSELFSSLTPPLEGGRVNSELSELIEQDLPGMTQQDHHRVIYIAGQVRAGNIQTAQESAGKINDPNLRSLILGRVEQAEKQQRLASLSKVLTP